MHIGGIEVQLHSVLIPALDGDEWLTKPPGRYIRDKEPRKPLNKLGGPQRLHGHFGKEKRSFASTDIRTLDIPIRSLVSTDYTAPASRGSGPGLI